MISPGILFYNLSELEDKLLKINTHYEEFLTLIGSNVIVFHVDLILPSWAAKRGINSTPPFQRIYKLLSRRLKNQDFKLDLHIMGEKKETIWLLRDIATQSTTMNYINTVFVRQGYYKEIEEIKFGFTIGKWYDLGEWNKDTSIDSPSLIMTVKSGEKGQASTEEIKHNVITLLGVNSKGNITVDGGWSVGESSKLDKTTLVSSTSLWNTFETLCLH
jgi:hypothetical protein